MANPSFFLASKSLRRQMLLEQIGIRFEVIDIDLGGARFPGEDPASYVLRLALDKAQAGRAQIESGHCPPVLGTNMSVVVGDRILGKPNNRREATAMLRLLGGRKHWVLGGIALVDGHEWQALSVSEVNFRAVSAWERQMPTGRLMSPVTRLVAMPSRGLGCHIHGGPAEQLFGCDGAALV